MMRLSLNTIELLLLMQPFLFDNDMANGALKNM